MIYANGGDGVLRYKIGDVARILGISPDLIRYYEEKGVVSPEKDPVNNYRYYDTWDINFLLDCLWFKNFGYGIEQVAHIVSQSTYGDLMETLAWKGDEIEENIRYQQMLLERIRKYHEILENLRGDIGKCGIRRSAEFVRYLNRYNTIYDNDSELQRLSRKWLKYMPFSRRYFEVPEDDLLGDGDDYAWGFSIGMPYVEAFGIAVEPPVKHMPSRLCIHSAFTSTGKDRFTARHLDFITGYAEQNGLTVAGCAFGNLACSVVEKGEITGFFEVWLPIEETEDGLPKITS
jgi:DNA-binding transcriptional MerR regulator